MVDFYTNLEFEIPAEAKMAPDELTVEERKIFEQVSTNLAAIMSDFEKGKQAEKECTGNPRKRKGPSIMDPLFKQRRPAKRRKRLGELSLEHIRTELNLKLINMDRTNRKNRGKSNRKKDVNSLYVHAALRNMYYNKVQMYNCGCLELCDHMKGESDEGCSFIACNSFNAASASNYWVYI